MSYFEELARIKTKETIRQGLNSQRIHRELNPENSRQKLNSAGLGTTVLRIAFLVIGLVLGGIAVTQIVF